MTTKSTTTRKKISGAFSAKKGILSHADLCKRRNRILYYTIVGILVISVIVSIYPLLWMFMTAFKENIYDPGFFPKSFSFSKITSAWSTLQLTKYITNSAIVVAIAVAASVIVNGLAAYALAIIKPLGHKVYFFLVLITLMMPAVTNMVPLFQLLKNFSLLNSHIPLGLIFGANAFYLIMFKTYFETLPKSVIESAQLDGCNKLQIFFKIVLPMCKAIIMVVVMFTINAAWSDFTLPYLVLLRADTQTVMVKLNAIYNDANVANLTVLLAVVLSIIPPVVLFLIFQRQITDNVMSSGQKD